MCCKKDKRNIMASPENSTVETKLLEQIKEIDQRVTELNAEKSALQRLFFKVRRENVAAHDVTRKNSVNRILIENKILETLDDAGGVVSSRKLFQSARGAIYELKESTFRSHLHRMKARGLIQLSHNLQGFWTLPKKE